MHLQNEGRRRPSYIPTTPAPVGAGAGGCPIAYPTSRTIRRALSVIEQMPTEALVDLVECLINRLDDATPDVDLEPETDACDAGECGAVLLLGDHLPGDAGDAEPNSDDEPDTDDRGDSDDEPRFQSSLRAAGGGTGGVRRQTMVAVFHQTGRAHRPQYIQFEAIR